MIDFVMFCLKESYDFLERYKKSQDEARQVERGSLSLSASLYLGTPCQFFLTTRPTITFRAQRRFSNVTMPSMVLIRSVIVAGVETVHTQDTEDDSIYSGGVEVNHPSMTPEESIEIHGEYTGYIPPGYAKGELFHYSIAFIGHLVKET
jgi:hypothetical protein